MRPDFEDLPFFERPDLTPYLIHLTKNTSEYDEYSAFDNLVSILREGEIWGSDLKKGFVKGPHRAACFMDVPFHSLKYILNEENSDPSDPRYEAFGVFVTKKHAYKEGCRPVLYISDREKESYAFRKANCGGSCASRRATKAGSVGCTNGNGDARETTRCRQTPVSL